MTPTIPINRIFVWVVMAVLILLGIAAVKSILIKGPQVLFNREKSVEIKLDSVYYWRDQANRQNTRAQVAEANLASLKNYAGPLIDSVLKNLKITNSRLDYITAMSLETKGRVYTRVDTIVKPGGGSYLVYRGNDGFLDLTGNTDGNSFAEYTYTDSIVTSGYWKKRGLFKGGIWGKKDLYLNAYSLNPNTKIKHVTALQIDDTKDAYERVNFDLYAGGFFSDKFTGNAGAAFRYYLSKRSSWETYYQFNVNEDMGFYRSFGTRFRYTLFKF